MSTYDQYNGITKELEAFIKSNNKLFSFIDEANKMSRQYDFLKMIEPLQEEIERINSLKSIISQANLDSPIMKIAREADSAISNLSKSFQDVLLGSESSILKNIYEKELSLSTSFGKSIEGIYLGMQSELARISEISLIAEKTLAQIDFNKIGSLLNLIPSKRKLLVDSQYSFLEKYTYLFESFSGSLFSHPLVSITMPPKEYYFGSRLLEVITAPQEHIEEEDTLFQELQKENNTEIDYYLGLLNPSLLKLWRGAKEAAISSNPDAGRHFAVSLRELLTRVIHFLSPDDLVKKWSKDPKHFDKDGRPTRKVRLLYISKNIKHDPFDNFLMKDIDAILACMDVFQEGTHSINSVFGREQFEILSLRVQSTIIFLIRTLKDTDKT